MREQADVLMLPDAGPADETAREIITGALTASPAFAGLSAKAIKLLARAAQLREVRGGVVLLQHGEYSQALFLVASGRLSLSAPKRTPDGLPDGMTVVREAARGDVVGGVSLTTEMPRQTEVVAIRDTLLVVIARDNFDKLAARRPQDAVEILRHLARQVVMTSAGRFSPRDDHNTANVAVIPGHLGLDSLAFCRGLCEALGQYGDSLRLDAERVDAALGAGAAQTRFEDSRSSGLLNWLAHCENTHDYVVYATTDRDDEQWLRRSIRQADRVLVLVDGAAAEAVDSAQMRLLRSMEVRAPVELVVVHVPGARRRASPSAWMKTAGASAHHHVVAKQSADYARLARTLTGQSTGLVLGGGGARGFAHLGVLRAVDKLGLPIDAIGGASMGAYIGALMAAGHSADTALENVRESFVENNYLNDYAVPRVALLSGNKFMRRLDAVFGEQRIEDLSTSFYCVSTNLSRGEMMVHSDGLLRDWLAASMAVPGIVPPLVWKGELLCDGAIMNSLPYQVMTARGQGRVIGVDVSNREEFAVPPGDAAHPVPLKKRRGADDVPSIFRILHRAATVVSAEQLADRETGVDLYIRMPVSGIQLFDWDTIDTIVDAAYDHAMPRLEAFCERVAQSPARDQPADAGKTASEESEP